jgi:hypothetical protein
MKFGIRELHLMLSENGRLEGGRFVMEYYYNYKWNNKYYHYPINSVSVVNNTNVIIFSMLPVFYVSSVPNKYLEFYSEAQESKCVTGCRVTYTRLHTCVDANGGNGFVRLLSPMPFYDDG